MSVVHAHRPGRRLGRVLPPAGSRGRHQPGAHRGEILEKEREAAARALDDYDAKNHLRSLELKAADRLCLAASNSSLVVGELTTTWSIGPESGPSRSVYTPA
ncbi:hypothetical protein [Streptomyces sp. HUAS TT7]|uniref:hypothetical protein n=1 Tax=Streptomyces sp. HUAS TT7 TaxID=3447507 RepID=UPI003F65EA97